jgi:hypothetical protein
MESKVYRLGPYEEAIGALHEVQEADGYILAIIGPVVVVLPSELGAKIKPHIGSRIGILRTERDYRIRIVSAANAGSASEDDIIGAIGCER